MAKAWEFRKKQTPQNRYRLMWMDVKYEPTVKVAFDDNGKAVAERRHALRKPYQIVLDRPKTITAMVRIYLS
jgi:beta-galactosidase